MKHILLFLCTFTPLIANFHPPAPIQSIEIITEIKHPKGSLSHHSHFKANEAGKFVHLNAFNLSTSSSNETDAFTIHDTIARISCSVSDVSQSAATITYSIDDNSWKSWLSWLFPTRITLSINQAHEEPIGSESDALKRAASLIIRTRSTTFTAP